MPTKPGPAMQDPVGVIARTIAREDSVKASDWDRVDQAREVLGVPRDDELQERIANELFQDAGEILWSAERIAAYLFVLLTFGRSE